MKLLIQKSKDGKSRYFTSVGVRKLDDMIIIRQLISDEDSSSDVKIKITKKEFEKITDFVRTK